MNTSETPTRQRPTLPEPIEVAKFWVNRSGGAAVVSLRQYEGSWFVDVRRCNTTADGRLTPTSQGISITVRKLPELVVAIGKALMKARELGLIGGRP